MNRSVVRVGLALVLAAAGWFAAGRWSDHRLAACERRSARFSPLDLLARQPDGYHPAGSPAAGCDFDRVEAYASRQFVAGKGGPTGDATSGSATPAGTDRTAVTAFYRQVLLADA